MLGYDLQVPSDLADVGGDVRAAPVLEPLEEVALLVLHGLVEVDGVARHGEVLVEDALHRLVVHGEGDHADLGEPLDELPVGFAAYLLQLDALGRDVVDPVPDHLEVPSHDAVLDDVHRIRYAHALRHGPGLLGGGEEAGEEPVDGVGLVLPGDGVLRKLEIAVHEAVQGLLEHYRRDDEEAADDRLQGEVVGVDGALEEQVAVRLLDDTDAEEPLGHLPDALYLLPHQPAVGLHLYNAPPQHVVADDDPREELGVVAAVHVHDVYRAVVAPPRFGGQPEGAVALLGDEDEVALFHPRLLRPAHREGDRERRVSDFLHLAGFHYIHTITIYTESANIDTVII